MHFLFFTNEQENFQKTDPVIASRSEAIQSLSMFLDCFVAIAPRNDDREPLGSPCFLFMKRESAKEKHKNG
jgi:hypothetical protein